MIAAMTMIYGVCVWLFFAKLKLVKPNPISIAAAVVIGMVLIGCIVIAWQFSAPFSKNLVVSRYAVQVVPQVKGPIAKIHAKPREPLKKDKDILFEIQKDPFQFAVDQFTANLSAADQNVFQFEAAIRAANANVARSDAGLLAAKAAFDVAKETQRLNPNAIAKLEVTQLGEEYEAAKATVDQAKANAEQSQFALKSAKDAVLSVRAQLDNAKFNLQQCTVRAPSDGFIINWQAREGTMTTNIPLAAVGTFVDTSETSLVATFGQNTVKFVQSGDPIEIALKSHPGQVFKGKVDAVVEATGEGQFVTSGQLFSVADIGSNGMFAVLLKLDDPDAEKELAMGTAGSVVIYTDRGKPFHIISKVVVRMQAWQYYLIPQ